MPVAIPRQLGVSSWLRGGGGGGGGEPRREEPARALGELAREELASEPAHRAECEALLTPLMLLAKPKASLPKASLLLHSALGEPEAAKAAADACAAFCSIMAACFWWSSGPRGFWPSGRRNGGCSLCSLCSGAPC